MRRFGLVFVIAAAFAAAFAAPRAWAQVGAPVLGYLPAGGYLFPVNGIPASAFVAPAINFGGQFIHVTVSPRQDFALATSAATGSVLLAYPNGTTASISGVPAYPDSITMSPSGSAAVLWFSSSRKFEILSGLPSSVQAREVDATFLGKSSPDSPSALGVSDDGVWAAGAWAAGAWASGMWAFGSGGSPRSLLSGDHVYALTFYSGREDLAAATRNGIYSIAQVGGSATVTTLYSSQHLDTPAGLAIAADNQTLVMADHAGNIVMVNSGTGATTTTNCGCIPEGAFPMRGSVFRITGLTGSVFRIFDPSAGSVFVVPVQSQASGGGVQ